jgi:hypothetical protein
MPMAKDVHQLIPTGDRLEHIDGITCTCSPDVVITRFGVVILMHRDADERMNE